MADQLFGGVQAALDMLAVEQHETLAPIAEWVADTTRFVERLSALDPEAIAQPDRLLLQSLMQQCAQLIITAQQDVLKQVMACALASAQQRKAAPVKRQPLPPPPIKLARP